MLMTKPGVQKPHWLPWWVISSDWTGWRGAPLGLRPSTVVTCLPCSWGRNRMQALRGREPFASVTMTVQTPQSPSLQPSFVPVRCRSSRSQSRRVVVGFGSVKVTEVPLSINVICMGVTPPRYHGCKHAAFDAA